MNFRTEIYITPSEQKISLKDNIFLIGSCFSTNIAQQLLNFKFNALSNPFGTLFNPLSIFMLLEHAMLQKAFKEDSYVQNQEVWYNFNVHSDLSSLNKNALKQQIENSLQSTQKFLTTSDVIIMTFGTAYVYEQILTKKIVSNCHKMPAELFKSKWLSVEEIVSSFSKTLKHIYTLNPNVRVILTVSPVRHIKNALEQNNISKSILRLACEKIKETHKQVEYFPAFEIMIDDLRDYRFYSSDMIHPNNQAINYIWNKFIEIYFDEKSINFIQEWQQIINALSHKPTFPSTKQHKKFVLKTLNLLNKFKNIVNISNEEKYLKAQL